jgi:hypothetical protein
MNIAPGVPRPPSVWFEPIDPARIEVVGYDENGCEIFQRDVDKLFIRHDDPPLDGVPHRPEESIFLEQPGFADNFTSIVDAARNSAARSREVGRALRLITDQPALGEVLMRHLGIMSDPNIVGIERVRAISSQILERATRRGLDIFQAAADRDSIRRAPVAAMTKRYVEFRNQNEEDRQESARAEARQLLRDPDEIDRLLETFELIEEADILTESGAAAQASYRQGITEAIGYVLSNESQLYPTALGMERWVSRWAGEDDRIAEQVLRKLIQAAQTPEAITNLLYDVAFAGFTTGDTQIMNRTSELLCWGTDLMPWDSQQGMHKELARFNADPEVRQKANEIVDVAFSYQAITSTQRQASFGSTMFKIHGDSRYHKMVARQIIDHPDVMRELGWDSSLAGKGLAKRARLARQLMRSVADFGSRFKSGGLPAVFATHDTEVGQLGEWYRDYYASFSTELRAVAPLTSRRRVMAHLNFPNLPTTEIAKTTAAEAANIVQTHLQAETFDGVIEQRTFWNTLGYLVPENLGSRAWRRLLRENVTLRDEMVVDKRHSLSPRGDRMEIMNTTLRDLSFRDIDFYMDPRQKDVTRVTIRVGNAAFSCSLDREYNFRENGTNHNLGLSQTSPFLEFVVLSHLHQIHNADPSQRGGGKAEAKHPRRVEHRRAHRRVLQLGSSPSEEQISKAIDEYGIDLVRQNRLRLARGEQQLITWVSEVRPEDVAGRGPVYSEGDKASMRLHDILEAQNS